MRGHEHGAMTDRADGLTMKGRVGGGRDAAARGFQGQRPRQELVLRRHWRPREQRANDGKRRRTAWNGIYGDLGGPDRVRSSFYVVIEGVNTEIASWFTSPKPRNGGDQMMNSVATVWGRNETWLVLAAGRLWVHSEAYVGDHDGALPYVIGHAARALGFFAGRFEFRWAR